MRFASLLALLIVAGVANAATPMVAAGSKHTLALRSDGIVFAWGSDEFGQLGIGRGVFATTPIVVPGLPAIRAIGSGYHHVLATRADGVVFAWGLNTDGQLGDGSQTDRPSPVVVAGLSGITAVAGGLQHSIALRQDGTLWSWGANSIGQLGDGTTTRRLTPVPVSGLGGVTAIAAGNQHNIALRIDGTVWTWGRNTNGELGDGTTTQRNSPQRVTALSGVIAVAAGGNASAALRSDGTVWEWGQALLGPIMNRTQPVQSQGVIGAVSISTGNNRIRAVNAAGAFWEWRPGTAPTIIPMPAPIARVTNGTHTLLVTTTASTLAYGDNQNGQLGDGTTITRFSSDPRPVVGLTGVAALAAGEFHSVALGTDGVVHTWGADTFGQLGRGAQTNRSLPVQVPGLTGVVHISAGRDHSLAVREDGSVWAWGRNDISQLGDGTNVNRPSPVVVSAITNVRLVEGGEVHSLALRQDGTLFAWGSNFEAQIGDGTFTVRTTPVPVPGMTNVIAMSAALHSIAVKQDGTVWAWGVNAQGQLGLGTQDPPGANPVNTRPVQVPGLAGIGSVNAGAARSFAVADDGTAWAWGDGFRGALGHGRGEEDVRSPVRVAGLTRATAISSGAIHGLAARTDGSVWGWGTSDLGQLADDLTTARSTPFALRALSGIVQLSAGESHSVFLRQDGTVAVAGDNRQGQLGDGTYAQRVRPALAVNPTATANLDLTPETAATAESVPFFVVSTGGISATTARVDTNVLPRAQDVGSLASVYAFALAPASSVRPAPFGEQAFEVGKARSGKDGKETAVSCVLAQLTASGQLQAVSASSLQAFVTGVLGSQGQAVTVINGVPTVNIGGATFFVGYGPNASTMLNGGTNRSVATIPGPTECKPQAPKAGWWWDPPTAALGRSPRDGTGYSIEVQGNLIFFAAFLYDDTGRSKWHVATGRTSLDGSLFTGDLLEVRGGQTLFGPYNAPASITPIGPITLAFNSATAGTMVWPGGTVPLGRFDIVPGGLAATPQDNVPESGWWWNPAESGRGFFIEWQNGSADIAGYMYDEAGNPIWYLTVVQTPDPARLAGNWWTFANGMTLTGAWKPNARINDNVAPVSIQFHSRETATLMLPGGRTTNLVRHRF